MKALLLFAAALAAIASLTAFAAAPARGTAKLRTVLVVPQGNRTAPARVGIRDCIAFPRTCVNGIGRLEVAYAVKGVAPRRLTTGTILTDRWCQADRYGVSHCSNDIRLASGRVISVRHDHAMANDPCLVRGERVLVRRA
jgi:hypothetical protein